MFTLHLPQGLLQGYLTLRYDVYWDSETLAHFLNVDDVAAFHRHHQKDLHPLPEVLAATQNYVPGHHHKKLMVHITFLEVLWRSQQPHAVKLFRHFLKGNLYIRPLDASHVMKSFQYSPGVTLFISWLTQFRDTWIQRRIFQETCSPLGSPLQDDTSPVGSPNSPLSCSDEPYTPVYASPLSYSPQYTLCSPVYASDTSPLACSPRYTPCSPLSHTFPADTPDSPLSFSCHYPPGSPPASLKSVSSSWDLLEGSPFLQFLHTENSCSP